MQMYAACNLPKFVLGRGSPGRPTPIILLIHVPLSFQDHKEIQTQFEEKIEECEQLAESLHIKNELCDDLVSDLFIQQAQLISIIISPLLLYITHSILLPTSILSLHSPPPRFQPTTHPL